MQERLQKMLGALGSDSFLGGVAWRLKRENVSKEPSEAVSELQLLTSTRAEDVAARTRAQELIRTLQEVKLTRWPKEITSSEYWNPEDADAPLLSESSLYHLLGKEEARTVGRYMRELRESVGLPPYREEDSETAQVDVPEPIREFLGSQTEKNFLEGIAWADGVKEKQRKEKNNRDGLDFVMSGYDEARRRYAHYSSDPLKEILTPPHAFKQLVLYTPEILPIGTTKGSEAVEETRDFPFGSRQYLTAAFGTSLGVKIHMLFSELGNTMGMDLNLLEKKWFEDYRKRQELERLKEEKKEFIRNFLMTGKHEMHDVPEDVASRLRERFPYALRGVNHRSWSDAPPVPVEVPFAREASDGRYEGVIKITDEAELKGYSSRWRREDAELLDPKTLKPINDKKSVRNRSL